MKGNLRRYLRAAALSSGMFACHALAQTSAVSAPYNAVNVTDYGANGSDTVDDLTSIQAAIDAAGVNGTVIFPKGNYFLSGTLTTTYDQQVWEMGGAKLLHTTGWTGPVIRIGTDAPDGSGKYQSILGVELHGGQFYYYNASLPNYPVSATYPQGWSDGNVGIEIINGENCQLLEQEIYGFQRGLYMRGYGTGCVHNKVMLKRIQSCKWGIDLYADGPDNSKKGWCNANTFYGAARIGYVDSDPDATNGYAIRLDRNVAGPGPSDDPSFFLSDNRFHGMYLEAPTITAGNPSGALYLNSQDNVFECGYEGFAAPFIKTGTDFVGANNHFIGGFGLGDPSAAISATVPSYKAWGGPVSFLAGGSSAHPAFSVQELNSGTNKTFAVNGTDNSIRSFITGFGVVKVGELFDASKPATGGTDGIAGRIFWNTSQGTLNVDDSKAWTPINGGLFAATADIAADAATDETLLSSGVGVKQLSASFLVPGRTVRVRVSGFFRSTSNPTIEFKLKLGGTTLCTSGPITVSDGANNHAFDWEGLITCRTANSGMTLGTVMAEGKLLLLTDDSNPVPAGKQAYQLLSTAPVSIDTTTALTVDATAAFSTANVANYVKATVSTIDIVR